VSQPVDIAVIGAGAAGLMAAISAGRANPNLRILALDGAQRLGAKILVAGGGRCNVTHYEVDERQYAGSSPNAIKKVLRRFDVPQTIDFFRDLGVELKREDTGKLFPTTDDAHTVLNALLSAAREANVELHRPCRVDSISRTEAGFLITPSPLHPSTPSSPILARRIILATGGKSLPKTGSDGRGHEIARSLGHTITPTFPALVPLTLPRDHWICQLSGITIPATVELRAASGKRLKSFTNSTLLTHFGLSGPSILDISRYFLALRPPPEGSGGGVGANNADSPKSASDAPQLVLNFLPTHSLEQADADLQRLGKLSPARYLRDRGLPDRLADAICRSAGIDPSLPAHSLTRDARRALARAITETPLPITGSRGYLFAEVTAGGVPLSELHLDTMESRIGPGLYLCGEICDVDGRIGGFNFQWAWASGFIAGTAAATSEPRV
jgi:predicted flavoprotein YhiN